MPKSRRWWLLLLFIPLTLGGAFILWAEAAANPAPEARRALETDSEVRVESDPWLTFHPQVQNEEVGLILYPGGRVDPRAYAPLAREVAAGGFLSVIVPMPLNLAVLDWDAADEVMQAHPEISAWVIGGHSLGGAMAARYAHRRAEQIAGLLLLAAYPASSDDLSGAELAVTSIYGTRDGLATPGVIVDSRDLLPADAQWIPIEGGNHAQFGWYGQQSGDNPPTIAHREQLAQTVQGTLDLLERIDWESP